MGYVLAMSGLCSCYEWAMFLLNAYLHVGGIGGVVVIVAIGEENTAAEY